ncbi:hypothetical protein MKX03_014404 [Papaver bracteatum]|nr:hypothetical protein MKX03_014404 [Papaver bracteatum]
MHFLIKTKHFFFLTARSYDEAAALVRVLDEAGIIFLFRDKVHLHPDKVVDLVGQAVPLALAPEDDPRRVELKKLQKEKEDILMFWLTNTYGVYCGANWEFSWDVMGPITFITTATGLVVGYAYFLCTSKDPSYPDLRMRLFLSMQIQRKLYKRRNFNVDRFVELQNHFPSSKKDATRK